MLESLPRRIYRALLKPAPWRRWTATARALPDFLIIGAMRAGTTSLHDLACSHPLVRPGIRKEVHYFDLYFDRGLNWYQAHFPRSGSLARTGSKTGETSPYYLFHPEAPRRAARQLAGARIIAILRDPVDRTYSHYWHTVRHRAERLSFEEALAVEDDRLAREAERLRSDPGRARFAHQHYSYQARSIYADQLAAWFSVFPRERVLVLEQEQFFSHLWTGANRLFEFLELPPHEPRVSRHLNERAYPPMKPETRARLARFFAPHNARLFDLLGESFAWWD